MTIAERVIQKCGGAEETAKLLGITATSVHRWKYPKDRGGSGGIVPSDKAQLLLDAARKSGIELEPSDFFEVAAQ